MSFDRKTGLVWSNEPAYDENRSWLHIIGRTGLLGAGAYSALAANRSTHGYDNFLRNVTQIGNESPLSILNTLNIPEFGSPWATMEYQGFTGNHYSWQREQFQNNSTLAYLERATGKSKQELAHLGILGDAGVMGGADNLIFRRTGNANHGTLHSVVNGVEHLVSDNMMMMQLSEDLSSPGVHTKVNRAAKAVFAALDMWSHPNFYNPHSGKDELNEVFGRSANKATFFPIPAPSTPINDLASFNRATTYARSLNAFSMERFNRLLTGTVEHLTGDFGVHLLEKIGLGSKLIPGTGNAMMFRAGGLAMKLGAVGLAIQQGDWVRRNYGMLGNMGASLATSAGIGYLAHKGGLGAKTIKSLALGSFAAQMMLPGFDQGIVPGLATAAANLSVARGGILNPFNYYRRGLESYLPGVTDYKTGALLGVGVLAATHMEFGGRRIVDHIARKYAPGMMGHNSVRQQFWLNMKDYIGTLPLVKKDRDFFMKNIMHKDFFSARERMWMRGALRRHTPNAARHANEIWNASQTQVKNMYQNMAHPILQRLESDVSAINTTIGRGLIDRIGYQLKGMWIQAKYAFHGVDIQNKAVKKVFNRAGIKVPLGRSGLLFLGTMAAQQLLTGGLLGSMESADELRQIYRGNKLVAVKKGRFWEGGSTPYEGGETEYYRPHAYSLMMNRTRQKGIWGRDEDQLSPMYKFFLKNFTYALEDQNYYDRPYPLTSAAFQDVPVIGGILANTIGRLIKPQKLMHEEEWYRDGEFASVSRGKKYEPNYDLGGVPSGVPVNKLSGKYQLAAMTEQFRELEGLTGFIKNTASKVIHGESNFYPSGMVLADAGMMTDPRTMFWEQDLGGMAFTNEIVRRLLPAKTGGEQVSNPIMNSMPSWLPEYLRYGDPYRAVEWGEARMPGVGYETRHPELTGLDPEDYPDIYKYEILGDVAPLSREFRNLQHKMYQDRIAGYIGQADSSWMDEIDQNIANRFNLDFSDKRPYKSLPGSRLISDIWWSIGKGARNFVAPAEYLIPAGFRPFQKLLADRDPIEHYEWARMFGTKTAIWDSPVHDWLRPAYLTLKANLGFRDKPGWREEADAIQDQFDKLEYIKYVNLANQASQIGDKRAAQEYYQRATGTVAGLGTNATLQDIFYALPKEERGYLNAFAQLTGSDRKRVLEMIPENLQPVYESIWKRLDSGDQSLYQDTPVDAQYLQQHYEHVMSGLEYMPDPDWVGFNDGVNIDDIKVKYVSELGKNIHDFGIWESQVKNVERMPYLEGSTDFIDNYKYAARTAYNYDSNPGSQYNIFRSFRNTVNLTYNDRRDNDIQDSYNRMTR